NGKLFIYDWIRGWIKAVTLLPNGDFDKMEPFMEHTKWHNAIDMEVGPDGKLYVLEYGTGWFAKNDDAGLSRIDYNGGNRPPKVTAIKVDKTSGALPLTIKVTVEAADPENDAMTYTWTDGNGQTKETSYPEVEFTLDKPGDYAVSVAVKDKKGAASKSNAVHVYAGNTAPEVTILLTGNQSFYFPGKPVSYTVSVSDKEEGSTIDADHLYVTADYLEGADKAAIPQGHQTAAATVSGRSIMLSLDCKTCHKTDEKSVGPSFTEVAKRYYKNSDAVSYLTAKIIKGGSGAWGEVAMAAHPELAEDDAKQIVHWVLTLANPAAVKKSLPATGSIPVKAVKENEALYISATYTDKGGTSVKPLSGESAFALRSSKLTFGGVTNMKAYSTVNAGGMRFMVVPGDKEGWFSVDSIDLQGVNGAVLLARWQGDDEGHKAGFVFELRLGGGGWTKDSRSCARQSRC
ncbi:MAG TPA: PKD domain-containing protein, partial [Agriterribacter sp.]|nr:PKD domain-containing protein [Agriterribacter sp.]